jgi:hypothetical protein
VYSLSLPLYSEAESNARPGKRSAAGVLLWGRAEAEEEEEAMEPRNLRTNRAAHRMASSSRHSTAWSA